jgi:hypothetical protein
MYQVTILTCSFVYSMGLQPVGIIHNNLAGDAHNLLIFHVQPTNQPTIRGVDLCHRKFGCPLFTETRVIRYQPFASVHNNRLHFQCYTTDKGSNKICENNIILPTNIQYLKIHIRNWIWSQTSSDTQTELNIHGVTKCNQLQYVKCNTTSRAVWPSHTSSSITIHNMIYVTVKTCVTNLPFTIHHQIPVYNWSPAQCRMWICQLNKACK